MEEIQIMLDVMKKMDKSILELVLAEAFYDMCLCEGEEFVQCLESYISDVLAGKCTEEQNKAFLEVSEPYIMNTIRIYESIPAVTVPADLKTAVEKTTVAADVLKQNSVSAKKKIQNIKGFNVSPAKLKILMKLMRQLSDKLCLEFLRVHLFLLKKKLIKLVRN